MAGPRNPSLYQINTRVWLTEISLELGRRATLDDITDTELDRLAEAGFDWIWLLSVWQTGPGAQRVSRENADWRREFHETLPDLREEDIAGSGFAITGYRVHNNLGGDAALARLRERLRKRGLKLMLDFVPNHMGLDHPWIEDHPDFFIEGTEHDLASAPQNYTLVKRQGGDLILAYGRDPYFAGWPDTLQLDYANPATQDAMIGELTKIADQCDGVRCDMAMLVLPDVFERTWGRRARSSGRRLRSGCASAFLDSFSWPRSIGTWSGRYSNRDSTTPTTNGSTIACEKGMPSRSASIFTRDSITNPNWPDSWRITTNRGRLRRSLPTFIRPQL